MREPNIPPGDIGTDQSGDIGADKAPIPVPPVEESWTQMKNALDIRMPVVPGKPLHGLRGSHGGLGHGIWGHGLWVAAAAVVGVTTILVVKSIFYDTKAGHGGKTVGTSATTQTSSQAAGQTDHAKTGHSGPQTITQSDPITSGHPDIPATGRSANETSTRSPNEKIDRTNFPAADRTGNATASPSNNATISPSDGKTANRSGKHSANRTNRHGNRTNRPIDQINRSTNHANQADQFAVQPNHPIKQANKPTNQSNPPHTRDPYPHPLTIARTTGIPGRSLFTKADSAIRRTAANKKNSTANLVNKSLKRPRTPREKWMVAGLSLAKSFPIAGQETSGYSINGHERNLSDIAPSVYVKYFLNDDLYVQARVTPYNSQYTKPATIDSSATDTVTVSPGQYASNFNVVTLKKLFYGDLGLTVHQRVWKGLWLGAGVDYSRLTGGAAIQQRVQVLFGNRYGDTTYSSETAAITGQNYVKVTKSDWRVMLEAEYAWWRLKAGATFQQALTSYLPASADGTKKNYRNSSLSVHLSYDLWVKKRQ